MYTKKCNRKFCLLICFLLLISIIGSSSMVFAEAENTSNNTSEKAPSHMTSDTFISNGGSYDLNYVFNKYNLITRNNAHTQDVIGPMIVGGNLSGNQTSYGGLSVRDPHYIFNYPHPAHTFIKGATGSMNQLITNSKGINLYAGSENSSKSYTIVTKTSDSGPSAEWNNDQYYFTNSYMDFDAAFESFRSQAAALTGTQPLTTENLRTGNLETDGYELEGFTLSLKIGGHYDLETLSGITVMNYVGDPSENYNTTVTVSSSGSVSIAKTMFNGAEGAHKEVTTSGTSISYILPHATSVTGNAVIGHILAPNAKVTLTGGDYSGCVIADSLDTGAAETHMWPYGENKEQPKPTPEITSASITIKAKKTVDGKTPSQQEIFDFVLEKYEDGQWTPIDQTQNDGETISFQALTYKKHDIGQTYWYRISEKNKPGSGYVTDAASYLAKVVVSSEDSDGKTIIKADVSYSKGADIPSDKMKSSEVTAQKYEKNLEKDLTFEGNSNLIGLPLNGQNFVIVKQANAKQILWTKEKLTDDQLEQIRLAANSVEGQGNHVDNVSDYIYCYGSPAEQTLDWGGGNSSDPKGKYWFDVIPDGKNSTYALATAVSHFIAGNYPETGVKDLIFNNLTDKTVYKPTQATFSFKKLLNGQSPDESQQFTFQAVLKSAPEGTDKVEKNLGAKNLKSQITFQTADGSLEKPGTYLYEVSELPAQNFSADKSKYYVSIEVAVASDNQLSVASVTYYAENSYDSETNTIKEGAAPVSNVTFQNSYAAAATSLSGTKSLEGNDLENNQFTFQLKEVDQKGSPLDQGLSLKASNDSTGKFQFESMKYTTPGTHYYEISEENGGSTIDGIQYDNQVRTVKVHVLATESGLKAVVADDSSEKIAFQNKYVPTKAAVSLSGSKILEGRNLTAEQLQFELYQTDDEGKVTDKTPLQTVKNDASGKFSFSALEYDSIGTHHYLIKEKNGGQTIDQIVYDNAVVPVTVTVNDDGKGRLTAEAEYKTGTQSAQFTNIYQEEEKGSITVTKKITTNGQPQENSMKDTFYAALFNDHTKISDVKAIHYDGQKSANSVTFDNLPQGAVYHVWETDQDGNRLREGSTLTTDASSYTVTQSGTAVSVTPQSQAEITNDMTQQYYYDASLKINKEVLRGDKKYPVTATFYAGVFTDSAYKSPFMLDRNGDGMEENVVVPLTLNQSSHAEAVIDQIPVDPETKTAALYVAETNSQGKPIDENAVSYQITIENNGAVTVNPENTAQITITNTYPAPTPDPTPDPGPLPDPGYGQLTVTKQITKNGMPSSDVTKDTFYAGIFDKNKELIGQIKQLDYTNKGTNSVTFAPLAVGKVYYVYETDSLGNPLDVGNIYTSPLQDYTVSSGSGQSVVITTDTKATITNDLSEYYYYDASLKINKEVFRGNDPFPVTDTFYAGVFTDKDYTTPLTLDLNEDGTEENVVVPLTLQNANYTSAEIDGIPVDPVTKTATVYVTETDRDGNPIAGNPAINFTVTVQNHGKATVSSDKTEEITITNTYSKGQLIVKKAITRNGLPAEDIASDIFYVGVFDKDKNLVGDVKELNYDGQNNNVVFDDLTIGEIYYIYETDAAGNPLENGDIYQSDQSVYAVSSGSGKQITLQPESQVTITNDLSESYYYDGGMTITKKVLLGKEDYNVVNTYYAGIFTDKNYSKLLQLPDENGNERDAVFPLALKDACEMSIELSEIPLGTYYVTETDKNGKPLDSKKTEFHISVKNSRAEVSQDDSPTVLITNTYDKKMTPPPGSNGKVPPNGTSFSAGKVVQTGDSSSSLLAFLLIITAGFAMALLFRKKIIK